ncbi:MAG: HU family DNA-binding protein [Deltaproteobacteria bacterium]|nr:HU family DNA-binding protein [Deltaproteobacteria bacterium]
MTRNDLIDALQKRLSLPRTSVVTMVDALLDEITRALDKGEAVKLTEFGTFQVKQRGPRTARDPRTGKPLALAASRAVAFKPSTALKAALNPPAKTPTT